MRPFLEINRRVGVYGGVRVDYRLFHMECMADSTLTMRLAVRPFLEINRRVGVYGGLLGDYRQFHMECMANSTVTTDICLYAKKRGHGKKASPDPTKSICWPYLRG